MSLPTTEEELKTYVRAALNEAFLDFRKNLERNKVKWPDTDFDRTVNDAIDAVIFSVPSYEE